MNEDLLRELEELREEVRGLNDRLDKVTTKVMESVRNEIISNDNISIEKGVKEVEQALNQYPVNSQPMFQSIPQSTPQRISNSNFTPIEPIQKVSTLRERLQQKQSKKQKQPTFNSLKSNGDLETNIGKNVMGVLASLLIFIGIASFVVFVFQDMSEILKFTLMHIFSFGLFGLGIWRVEKNKNGFSLSLSGCGIGAVFISILLSYFYFNFLTSQLLLFGLLVGWSAIVLLLSKRYESDIFVIISYIGFYIALLLGAWSDMVLIGEPVNTIGLMLILHSIFIYLIGSKNIPISETFYKIFPFVSLLGSFILILNIGDADYYVWSALQLESIVLVFAMLCQMGASLWYTKNLCGNDIKVNQVLLIFVLLSTILVNTVGLGVLSNNYYKGVDSEPLFHSLLETEEEKNRQVMYLDYDNYDYELYDYYEEQNIDIRYAHKNENGQFEIHNDNAISVFLLISAICHLVFIEWLRLKEKYPTIRNICLYGLVGLLAIVCSTNMFAIICTLTGTTIIAGLLLLYGKDDKVIFKMSLITYFIGLIAGCSEYRISFLEEFMWAYCIFVVLNICYLVFVGICLKKYYKLSNKVWYYLISTFGLLCLVNIFGDYYSNVISDSVYKILELQYQDIVFIQPYDFHDMLYDNPWYNFFNYEFAVFLIYIIMSIYGLLYNLNNGLNCIMLLVGVTLIHNIEIGWLQFLLILMTSLQCFIGSRELLSRNKRILEYYVGVKVTLFINIVMIAFIDSELGYIYSIVCLLIAVASIIWGFREELKSFRLYGLILSLCSVLKLVMIDISYDNSLGRIFSFIGAGLLCFAIVWIYNKMSERLKEIE